jgi:hypothetical protein
LNFAIALVLVLKVGDVTQKGRSKDVAEVLACAGSSSDTLYISGAYPYDLPFYVQTTRAMVTVEDWPTLRKKSGDGWQRELFEGADFDAKAAQVLQSPEVLISAGLAQGNWFITRSGLPFVSQVPGWTLFFKGTGWDLYRSGGTTAQPEGAPVAAATTSFPGCKASRK